MKSKGKEPFSKMPPKIKKEELGALRKYANNIESDVTIGNRFAPLSVPGGIHKSDSYITIHGCARCNWMMTDNCPHKNNVPPVTKQRYHSNRICKEKVAYIEEMRDVVNDGQPNAKLKEVQFKEMLDAHEIANYKRMQMMTETDEDLLQWRSDDALKWTKMSLDSKFNKVKQSEGSKVTVSKGLNPLDFARMVEEQDVIDVEISDEKGGIND